MGFFLFLGIPLRSSPSSLVGSRLAFPLSSIFSSSELDSELDSEFDSELDSELDLELDSDFGS